MDTKKITSFSQSNGIQADYADAGQYVGISFYFTGTNASTKTGTFADLGRVLTSRFEKQKDNIDFNDLKRILNIRGGVALIDSTTSGDFEAYVLMLFTPETVASAVNVLDGEELNVEWQPGDDGTVFDSLDVLIWGRTANFPELGKLNYNRKTETYSGAVSADLVRLYKSNIQDLYIDDPSDILSLIQVDTDERSIQDAAPYGVLRGITLSENTIEDAAFDFARVPFYTPGSIAFNTGGEVTITTTGAGDVGLITASWEES